MRSRWTVLGACDTWQYVGCRTGVVEVSPLTLKRIRNSAEERQHEQQEQEQHEQEQHEHQQHGHEQEHRHHHHHHHHH